MNYKKQNRRAKRLAIFLALCMVLTGLFGTVAYADDPPTKADLEAKYNQMKTIADALNPAAYETATWDQFQNSLTNAKSKIDEAAPVLPDIIVAIGFLDEGYNGLTMRTYYKFLLNSVAEAKDVKAAPDYLSYPLLKRTAMETALIAAETALIYPESTTDSQYNILWQALSGAIQALLSAGYDYRGTLEHFVQYAEDMLKPGNIEKYIDTSVQNLQSEVNASKNLLANAGATAAQLNTQLIRLQLRINQMYEKGNKTDLAEAYNVFSRYNSSAYTVESWNVMLGVLAQIDALLKNNNALPGDITKAFDLLLAAEKQLVYKPGQDPSLNPGGLGNGGGGIDTFTLLQAMNGKYWTGKPVKPAPYIVYNGKKLVRGKDYSLSFGKNTDVGPGTITVTGLGAYRGSQSVTVPFKILPSKVSAIKATAGKKQVRFSWKKLTSKQKITSYVIHYRSVGATKWVQKFVSGKNASVTIKNLKKGKAYQYQIRSCRTVGKERYYSGWSGLKTTKKVL